MVGLVRTGAPHLLPGDDPPVALALGSRDDRGEVVIYAGGIPWLDAACGLPAQKGFEFGMYPFVIGDTIKLFIAAGLLPGAWHLLRRFRPSD